MENNFEEATLLIKDLGTKMESVAKSTKQLNLKCSELQLIFINMGSVVKHVGCCEVPLLLGEVSLVASWGSSLISQWFLERFGCVREICFTANSSLTSQCYQWRGLLERFEFWGISRQFTRGLLECVSFNFFFRSAIWPSATWLLESSSFRNVSGVCSSWTGLSMSFTEPKAGSAWSSLLRLTSGRRFLIVSCKLIVALLARHSTVRQASCPAFQSCRKLKLKLCISAPATTAVLFLSVCYSQNHAISQE